MSIDMVLLQNTMWHWKASAFCYCKLCSVFFLRCFLAVGSDTHLPFLCCTYVCIEHQLITTTLCTASITTVAPPPPGPAQTETTSQSSLSLREAACKWANLCGVWVCAWVYVYVRICLHVPSLLCRSSSLSSALRTVYTHWSSKHPLCVFTSEWGHLLWVTQYGTLWVGWWGVFRLWLMVDVGLVCFTQWSKWFGHWCVW